MPAGNNAGNRRSERLNGVLNMNETMGNDDVMDRKPLQEIDLDWESEKIIRWGAARAGVIVVAPVLGTMALIANEVYMITRLADLRGIKLSEGAVLGLLGSLGATFVGQSVATLIPLTAIQVPLAVSVTFGVGKAAAAWLKAGRPEDMAFFRIRSRFRPAPSSTTSIMMWPP